MFDDSKVSYELECHPEDAPVRGNAMCSDDPAFDREVENKILADLEAGNDWAWCTVRVVARYEGVDGIFGDDWLGCCNYAGREVFLKCPYYEDMCAEAKADLYQSLESYIISLRHAELID